MLNTYSVFTYLRVYIQTRENNFNIPTSNIGTVIIIKL